MQRRLGYVHKEEKIMGSMAAVRFRFGYPRFLVLRFSVLVPNFTHGFAVSGTRKSSVLVRILYFARGAPLGAQNRRPIKKPTKNPSYISGNFFCLLSSPVPA
ncbi:autophagy-related protein 13 [Striga asiatica]|uniref:Autophagy-related protein 13 n=1 Tax=Striga asiatica TaxID=4170 RepID=A0A5A7QBC4_STRAF|nr:autophagy-related protein 13 [Striga asiatica]